MTAKVAKVLRDAIEQTKTLDTRRIFRLSALFQPGYLDTHLSNQERDELEIEYFLAYTRGDIQGIKYKKAYMGKRSEYEKL